MHAQDSGNAAAAGAHADEPRRGRRAHAFAAAALAAFNLSVMSGHLASVDGLLIQRQAQALVVDGSLEFPSPVWTWTADPFRTSQYGIGLSLLYVPGFFVAAPLASMVPQSQERPRKVAEFYYDMMYRDPLYAAGGSWLHACISALSAFLVARLACALGGSIRAGLWALAFAGIGSIALAYARGDFSQPLIGLCWTAGLLAAVRARDGAGTAPSPAVSAQPALRARDATGPAGEWICAAVVAYAILVRPFEGLLLVPAMLLVLLPLRRREWSRAALRTLVVIGLGVLAGVAGALLVNYGRFGEALHFGYTSGARWMLPELATVAAVFVSPARGILWQLPAIVLVPSGVAALLRSGRRRELLAIAMLVGAMFVATTCWHVWWGGWFWGLRLFVPAIALLAVVAGLGVDRLGPRTRRIVPAAALASGFVFALPCVLTDSLAGWAKMADGPAGAWKLEAFPLYGAWRFLERVRAEDVTDTRGIDILWFRIAHLAGDWTMLVPLVLVAVAALLAARSRRELAIGERA